ITHVTGIPHSPTGQAIVERAHHTLKSLLLKQKGGVGVLTIPEERLLKAIYTLNFLNCSASDIPPIAKHFANNNLFQFQEKTPVLVHDLDTGLNKGPYPLI
ncbi:IGEB protein, partial [Bucco capensis]|nr:IGEB protein [Bucco capensis]